MFPISTKQVVERIHIFDELWNKDWKTVLFFGPIYTQIIHKVYEIQPETIIYWFPNSTNHRTRAKCSSFKKSYGEKLKMFPHELNHQFRVKYPFDVVLWNGDHTFLKMVQEINTIYRHTKKETQWIIHHCAPQRNWGKYAYGYIRLGVERQWLQLDHWFENGTKRGMYDDAWAWVHLLKRPPHPKTFNENDWKMAPEDRFHTTGEEWKLRERKVWISDWSARVESSRTADEFEALAKELEEIKASPYDEVDEWALSIWNTSPGCVVVKAELHLKKTEPTESTEESIDETEKEPE